MASPRVMLQAHERPRGIASRIKGRPALVKRLRSLLIGIDRFHLRAYTVEDQAWARMMSDRLRALLQDAERSELT